MNKHEPEGRLATGSVRVRVCYLEQVSVFDVDASSGPAHPQRPAVTSQEHMMGLSMFCTCTGDYPACLVVRPVLTQPLIGSKRYR